MNSRFTCLPSPARASQLAFCLGLFIAFLSGTPVLASEARNPVASFGELPATALAVNNPAPCVGADVVTIDVETPDFTGVTPADVPWEVLFQGSAAEVNIHFELVASAETGTNLEDWNQSLRLEFIPLVQGCFEVGIGQSAEPGTSPGIFWDPTSQEAVPVLIKAFGAPTTPVIDGFDTSVLCEGGVVSAVASSFTLGASDLSLSYAFVENLAGGTTNVLTQNTTIALALECNGPSATIGFGSGPLATGSYTYTATAANACGSKEAVRTVEIVADPDFGLTTPSACDVDASVLVSSNLTLSDYTMSNGVEPTATSVWSAGALSEDLTGATFPTPLDGDTFEQTVVLTYAFGGDLAQCQGEANVTQVVHSPQSILLDANVNGTAWDGNPVCEGSEVVLTPSPNGPESTFAFLDFMPSPNGIDGTTYTWESVSSNVEVTLEQTTTFGDSKVCVNEASFDIPVAQRPVLTWIESSDIVCEGTDASLQVGLVAEAATDVTWTLGGGAEGSIALGAGDILVDIELSGSFFVGDGTSLVSISAVDDNGCTSLALANEGVVEHVATPDVDASAAGFTVVCSGEDVQPISVPLDLDAQYAWSFNGTPLMDPDNPSPTFEDIQCGDFVELQLEETTLVDGVPIVCSSEVYDLGLEVIPTPDLSLSIPEILCEGLVLSFEVQDGNDGDVCAQHTTNLDWTVSLDGTQIDAGTDSNIDLNAVGGGELLFEVEAASTDGSTLCLASLMEDVIVFGNPQLGPLDISAAGFCADESLLISAAVTSDPNGGLTYGWAIVDEPSAFDLTSASVGEVTLERLAGFVTEDGEIELLVTDNEGCTAATSATFEVWELPELPSSIDWSATNICSGDAVTFSLGTNPLVDDDFTLNDLSITWTVQADDGTPFAVTEDASGFGHSVQGLVVPDAPWTASPNVMMVSWQGTLDDSRCTSEVAFDDQVVVHPNPEASLTSDNALCSGTPWMGSISGVSGLESPGNESFAGSDGLTNWAVSWADFDPNASGAVTFPVTALAEFETGEAGPLVCTSPFALELEVLDNPEPAFDSNSDNSFCSGTSLLLSVSSTSPNGAPTYQWDAPAFDLLTLPGGASSGVGDLPSGPSDGTVTVVATDPAGCVGEVSISLDVLDNPTPVDAGFSSEMLCTGEALFLAMDPPVLDTESSDLADVTYSWEVTEGTTSTITLTEADATVLWTVPVAATGPAPEAWSLSPTTVELQAVLTITDGSGCSTTLPPSNPATFYPLPEVSLAPGSESHVCQGTDWTGALVGATELTGLAGNLSVDVPGNLQWEVLWSDISLTGLGNTSFQLDAIADHVVVQCSKTYDLELEVVGNPEIDAITVSTTSTVPNAICEGTVANGNQLDASIVSGTGNGALTWTWGNSDGSNSFDINNLAFDDPNGRFTVNPVTDIADNADVLLTVVDNLGCMDMATQTVEILENTEVGDILAVAENSCSGEEITLTVDGVEVDESLNEADLVYTWNVVIPGEGAQPVSGMGASVTTTPSIDPEATATFTDPENLRVILAVDIAGCPTQDSVFDEVAQIYPEPLVTVSNPYVCEDQGWEANLMGANALTVMGPGGLADLIWQDASLDPDNFDVVWPQDYMLPATSQTQNTLEYEAFAEYDGGALVCSTTGFFTLAKRLAPTFNVLGLDNSGPVDDLVLCQGDDLLLETDAGVFYASIDLEWNQQQNIGSTFLGAGDNVAFVDASPQGPFNTPTLVEGFVTANYNAYTNTPLVPGFECIIEVPWSFQVLPTPVANWSVASDHACSGEIVPVDLTLVSGAETLNGIAIEWDWAFETNTLDETFPTTSPALSLPVEALYESELTGIFQQDMSLVVTDSYGCISATSEASFSALETPILSLDRPLICAGDTLELTASGADVYTWSPDTALLDAAIPDPIFNPFFAETGDFVSTFLFYGPLDGTPATMTGSLSHALADGTVALCTAMLDVNAVVYELPVLAPSLASDPAPFCEDDVVTFLDTNTDSDPANTVYSFFSNSGLVLENVPDSETPFTLIPDTTLFECTKKESHFLGGLSVQCETSFMELFEVVANPVIALSGNPGICQDAVADLVCEVNNVDSNSTYVCAWLPIPGVSVIPNDSTTFLLQAYSEAGVTPGPSDALVLDAQVTDNNGCKSALESLVVEVLATPIPLLLDDLLDEQCSPSQDCMELSLENVLLDPALDIQYFFDNESASPFNAYCANFVNPTSCPRADSMNVTVRFGHELASGTTLFCSSDLVDSTVVNPTHVPVFALSEPQACYGGELGNCLPLVHDSLAYDVCAGDSLSYRWFVTPLGDLTQNDVTVQADTTALASICMDLPGEVEVVLEIENSYGCSQTTASVPFIVRDLPVPELTFLQESICLPTSVSVLNSSAGASDFSMEIPGYPVYENFLSPLSLDIEFPGYYNAEFTVSNTHTIGMHDLTCSVDTEYVEAFEARTPPSAGFLVLPDTLVEYVNPVVEFDNISEGQIENIWSFGNGEGSSEDHPSLEYEVPGFYNAQLLVVNEFGCTDVFSQTIEVYTDLYVYVPNAFTPDNDGLNDAWKPSILGQDVIATYECQIFNRSGHVVFSTNDPNKAWTGANDPTGEGQHFSSGGEIFSWRIAIKKKDGEGAKVYTGQVQMVR